MIFKAVPYPLSLKISRVTQAYLLPSLLNVVKLRLRKSMHKVLWPKRTVLKQSFVFNSSHYIILTFIITMSQGKHIFIS